MATATGDRILIISHGHPELSKGGAEIAAYNLFQEYRKYMPGDVLFLARETKTGKEPFHFAQKGNGEILYYTNTEDYFTHTHPKKEVLWKEFKDLVERFKPTIVHFHHYIHMGIEMLRVVKQVSTKPKVFLTLHEYGAICNNNGQMIKTGSNKSLCYKASPLDCHQCFNSIAAGEFLLREHFLKSFFEKVDMFISPSNFLKDRYVNWGISADKIQVIENGQHKVDAAAEGYRDLTDPKYKIRFGYFGQLNPYKGIDVLLSAFLQLPKVYRKQVQLNLYGANLHLQTSEFQDRINDQIKQLGDSVVNYGPYEAKELTALMHNIDFVVVPSIWWENSPMVIQEAFMHKKPVICSNIGGMAEKVVDRSNGLHFSARSAFDLAEKIKLVCNERGLHKELANQITEPLSIEGCAAAHLKLYQSVTEAAEIAQA